MITVFLGKALICIANICHPTLVGNTTPIGQYQIVQRFVEDEKFGEDVLKFHENDDSIFAIHRITKKRMKYMNNFFCLLINKQKWKIIIKPYYKL